MSSQSEIGTAKPESQPVKKLMTAEELLMLPDHRGPYELIEGELRMMSPAGSRHGRVAMRVGSLLDQHVRLNKLGVVYAAETGFIVSRNPDTVRAPDAAFVCQAQLAHVDETDGYLELAPDVAVEVVSPNDSFTEVEQKASAWLTAGTRMVLVVSPETRTVHVHREANAVAVLGDTDTLDAGDIVPQWRVPVREFFA